MRRRTRAPYSSRNQHLYPISDVLKNGNDGQVSSKPLTEAVAKYVESAITHGECTESGDHRTANRAYDEVMGSLRLIRAAGDAGREELLKLLEHANDSVRCWAGTHLLKSDGRAAKKVLKKLASKPGLVAFDAKMVLSEWRKGNLKIP